MRSIVLLIVGLASAFAIGIVIGVILISMPEFTASPFNHRIMP